MADRLCLAAALAAAGHERELGAYRAWNEVAPCLNDPDERHRSLFYRVPRGHPVELRGDVDYGPTLQDLAEFHRRSGVLSQPDVVALVDGWSEQPWRSGVYDRVAEIGRATRPAAHALARGFAALDLPQKARLAIKDAAGAIALRDLVAPSDYETLTQAWRLATGEEP